MSGYTGSTCLVEIQCPFFKSDNQLPTAARQDQSFCVFSLLPLGFKFADILSSPDNGKYQEGCTDHSVSGGS